ncbi:serine carboxypeptidase-like 18 isoform X2 [Jatropha curcas]|nr:serine carboxypeptidase-like 18 isoform X2 [Jatropha curcas]
MYVNVDPSNTACVAALQTYEMCVKDLYKGDILEPKCLFVSPEANRRSMKEKSTNFILSPPRIPELWCRTFNYAMSYVWANNMEVQDALHVRKGLVPYWSRCNRTLSYTKNVPSVVQVNRYLSTKRLVLLVESGDRDMVVPFVGT